MILIFEKDEFSSGEKIEKFAGKDLHILAAESK